MDTWYIMSKITDGGYKGGNKMFGQIHGELINEVDEEKVQELIDSILTNGWQGAPILYHNSIGLITGSHRSAALKKIEEMYDNEELTEEQAAIAEKIDKEGNYSLDVTYIIDEFLENSEEAFEYDNLAPVFEGTEVEKWKDEIEEW